MTFWARGQIFTNIVVLIYVHKNQNLSVHVPVLVFTNMTGVG